MGRKKKVETLEYLKSTDWKTYISSSHWKAFSKSLLDEDDCVCEICGRRRWSFYKAGSRKGVRKRKPTVRFNVHHKVYNKGEEKRDEVLTICQRDHDLFHALYTAAQMDLPTNIFKELYQHILDNTVWEYTPHGK